MTSSTPIKDLRISVYPILPASVTGDLWHLAAAGILSKIPNYQNPNGLNVVPVIVASEYAFESEETLDSRKFDKGERDQLKDQRINGPATFNFLKDLGLDCVLILVKDGGTHYEHLTNTIFGLPSAGKKNPDERIDSILAEQKTIKNYAQSGFFETAQWIQNTSASEAEAEARGLLPYGRQPDLLKSRLGTRRLNYMAATTAAMSVLLDPITRAARLAYLTYTLSYDKNGNLRESLTPRHLNQPSNEGIVAQLNKHVSDFETEVKKLGASEKRKVVIYNNRSNTTNKQTNSTPDIFNYFQKKAEEHNMVVIVLDTGGPALPAETPVFDLFNKKSNAQYPGIDPLVTCQFFNRISRLEYVFGMFSGRTGSCDVAAFNGLNCFFWDTPLLELATYNKYTLGTYGVNTSVIPFTSPKPEEWFDIVRPFLATQIPQTYRVLQQCLVMGIGYPKNYVPAGADKKGAALFKAMRDGADDPFSRWLKGVSSVNEPLFPPCPNFELVAGKTVHLGNDLKIPSADIENIAPHGWSLVGTYDGKLLNDRGSLVLLSDFKTCNLLLPSLLFLNIFYFELKADDSTRSYKILLPNQWNKYIEGYGVVGDRNWMVRADTLPLAGFRVGKQATYSEIHDVLDIPVWNQKGAITRPPELRILTLNPSAHPRFNSSVPMEKEAVTGSGELSSKAPSKPPSVKSFSSSKSAIVHGPVPTKPPESGSGPAKPASSGSSSGVASTTPTSASTKAPAKR